MRVTGAEAVGIANISMDGSVLDTWYPTPALVAQPSAPTGTVRLGANELPPKLLNLVRIDEDRMVEQVAVRTTIEDLNAPPIDAHDVFLRLHLLSHRMVKPLEMNMEQALDLLSIVVWTNKGPCLPKDFEHVRTSLRSRGLIHVYGIEKLPRMVDYVVPDGIQITEAERVRLGAYLAPGTWVQREGYVSFNAGTLGPARIEGRISSGTVVGKNADLGISSTLASPYDKEDMRLGDGCTLGVGTTVLNLSFGDNVHIGHNIVIERESPAYFADTNEISPIGRIEGQSNWSIKMEAGHSIPVARTIPAIAG